MLHPVSRRVLMAGLTAGAGLAARGAAAQDSRFFDSAGVRIRYVESGQGVPVILVHGFSSTVERQWVQTGVFPKLAERYRVIALDGRGHGQSGKPHDAAQYGPAAAQDVPRLMDHLGLQKAHIVGYSLGAILNAYLVTRAPERFASCVLAGATGRFRWTPENQRRLEEEAAEMEQGSQRSQILRLWPQDKPTPTDEEVRQLSAKALEGQDYRALAGSRRGGANLVITPAEVAAIRVPTLGIVGTADPYLADFEAMKALNPAIKLVTVKDASHATAPSRPEFTAALMQFLDAQRA